MPTDGPVRDLRAEIDAWGSIRCCSPELARFLQVEHPGALIGRTLDELAVGSSRRTIVRAAADASSTGVEIGPVDLWLDDHHGAAIVGRFWVSRADTPARFDLVGHDLGALGPTERATALEAMLLDRVAAGDPLGSVLRGVAQLIEWRLPGTLCSVGAAEADGTIRHRFAPSMPPELVEALEHVTPAGGAAAGPEEVGGLVVFDRLDALPLAPWLQGLGIHRAWTLRIEHDDTVLGMLTVFVPDGLDTDGPTVHLLRHAADIAAGAITRADDEHLLLDAAGHDPLTGLPDRWLLIDRIAGVLDEVWDRGQHAAVLMIDLDDFKVVNDSVSHEAGDRVLAWVSEQLLGLRRPEEVVGRFGGDEFLLVTPVVGVAEALHRGEQVRAALDSSLPVGDIQLRTAASVGVAVSGPSDEPATLLRDADLALHRAKRDGRNRVVPFDRTIRDEMLDRVVRESALRQGLARRELVVHYQPIIDLRTFAVTGAEALVRWRRGGHRDLLGPGDFVPLAEEADLIAEIGVDVLEQAAAVAAELRTAGWSELTVAVNVSPLQLTDQLVPTVTRVLDTVGLHPSGLCLEVTESALAREGAETIVGALDALGVQLAIDDFGTGYSSLGQLRRFPVADVLKIDASFVADLEGPDVTGEAIVAAAVVLGHTLGMVVTAEGVETVGQLRLLRELGCDRAQGFLVSPAVPAHLLPSVLGEVLPDARSG